MRSPFGLLLSHVYAKPFETAGCAALRIEPLLLEHVLDLFSAQRQRHQLVAERLAGEQIGIGHRTFVLARDVDADAAGLVKAITAPPFAARLVAASCASAMISRAGFRRIVRRPRQRFRDRAAGRLAIGAASLS